jgi:hypothetical protein
MKIASLILSFLFFTSAFYLSAQPISQSLNKKDEVIIDSKNNNWISFHSSVKPYIVTATTIDSGFKAYWLISDSLIKKHSIKPIFNVNGSFSDKYSFPYQVLLGASYSYCSNNRFSLLARVLANNQKYLPLQAERIDSYKVVPEWGRYLFEKSGSYFTPLFTVRLNYQLQKHIFISTGYDKHFIGDGYRSLLLSDNAAPYPYTDLSVSLWRLQYFFMVAYLKDIDNLSVNARLTDKYGVFHYLDFNVTNRLSLGFYEAIIWWGSDPDTKRGIDVAYINPIIFFRSVEYSMHSPDNANLGGNAKLRLWRKTYLYGQFFLDDLRIDELKAKKGWWGNKYGFQAGFKTYQFINIKNLYVQSEINIVTPFTYSHTSSAVNYGTMYYPLTHPLGSNFIESLGVVRYTISKINLMGKFVVAQMGVDTSKTSFGQNIYKSYDLRYSNYNANLLQGKKQTMIFTELQANYILNPKYDLTFFISGKAYSVTNDKKLNPGFNFTVGLRTALFYNNERDF